MNQVSPKWRGERVLSYLNAIEYEIERKKTISHKKTLARNSQNSFERFRLNQIRQMNVIAQK